MSLLLVSRNRSNPAELFESGFALLSELSFIGHFMPWPDNSVQRLFLTFFQSIRYGGFYTPTFGSWFMAFESVSCGR